MRLRVFAHHLSRPKAWINKSAAHHLTVARCHADLPREVPPGGLHALPHVDDDRPRLVLIQEEARTLRQKVLGAGKTSGIAANEREVAPLEADWSARRQIVSR